MLSNAGVNNQPSKYSNQATAKSKKIGPTGYLGTITDFTNGAVPGYRTLIYRLGGRILYYRSCDRFKDARTVRAVELSRQQVKLIRA